MKIGINAIFFVPDEGGGIERYLRNVIRALQRIDDKNEYVLFTNRDNSGTFDLTDNFREYLVPISARFRPTKILWEQFIFPIQVKKAGVDLLFSPGNISPLFLPCPSVVVIHDLIPFKWPENFDKIELKFLKALFWATARRTDKIITVSKSSQEQILGQFNIPPDKTCVIPEACDKSFLDYQCSAEDKQIITETLGINEDFILYTASTRPHKNVGGLLRAFSHIKHEYGLRHLLVIAGSAGSDHKRAIKLAQDLAIREEVIFTGYISDDILPALYSAASLFVYPSFYEGFGLPVLEAMACGTPVVASNNTSLPEVVGNAGILVNPNNAEEMAKAIYEILSDRQCRNTLVGRGKIRVKDFSWVNTAKKVLVSWGQVCS